MRPSWGCPFLFKPVESVAAMTGLHVTGPLG